jgi:hypothetical protein
MLFLVIRAVGQLLTTASAILGIFSDFKHKNGAQIGRVTRQGIAALVLLVFGLALNVVLVVSDYSTKKRQAELATTGIILSWQARAVTKITILVEMTSAVEKLPSDAAVVAFLDNRFGQSVRMCVPLHTALLHDSQNSTIPGGAYCEGRRVTCTSFDVFGEKFGVSVFSDDLDQDSRFFATFGDLMRVTYSFTVPETIYDKDVLDRFLASLVSVSLDFDGVPLKRVTREMIAPLFVASTCTDPEWVSSPAVEIMFHRSSPDWLSLVNGE